VGRRREEVRRESRLRLRARVAALVAGLLLAVPSWAELSGRVVAVHDGDTITVLVAGRDIRVRLAGIDAPERGQPFRNASRNALEAQVAGREVRVVERGRDGYGRVLGRVYVGPVDVNAEQVRAGYAWVFRRFVQDPALLALEAEAKAAQRGLWRDRKPVPPWAWRERQAMRPIRTTPSEPVF
jgi:endonuclease YncB( thermonuclease family)